MKVGTRFDAVASEVDAGAAIDEVGVAGAGERVVAIVDAMKCEKMRQKVLEGAELSGIDEFEMGEGAVGLSGAELVEETHWRLGGVGEWHRAVVEADGIEETVGVATERATVGKGDIDDAFVMVANAEVVAPVVRVEDLVCGAVAIDDKGRECEAGTWRDDPVGSNLKVTRGGKDDLLLRGLPCECRIRSFERMDVQGHGEWGIENWAGAGG